MSTAMVDRANGNTYMISQSGGSLSIITLPDRWPYPTYGPFAGPYLDTAAGQIRLYMTGGTLTYEAVTFIRGDLTVGSRRVYAKLNGYNPDIYQITTPIDFEIGDPLQLTKVN